jgi:peroxiredoxin
VHRSKDAFEALETRVLVVGFESKDRARDWLNHKGISFPFLVDEARKAYLAYELERSLWRSLNPRNLWLPLKAILTGHRLRMIKADPTQLGADFIIERTGTIRLAYYGKDATDRPSVQGLLRVLRKAGDTGWKAEVDHEAD